MLTWVVITLVILPVILILAVPFTFALVIKREDKLCFSSSLSWLWGGITLKVENTNGFFLAGPLVLKKISFKKVGAERNKFEHRKKSKSKKIFRAETVFEARHFLNRQLLFSLYKTIQQILAALSIKLKGEASFGFEDPALTGLTYGFASAAGFTRQQPGLKLAPNFLEAGFKGFLSVRGRLTVGKVLFILVAFLLCRPARHLWWSWLRKEVFNKWRKSILSTT